MSDTLTQIHSAATALDTSPDFARVVGFLPPNFGPNTLVPLQSIAAPADAADAQSIEQTTLTDINDTAADMRLYLADVSAGDTADAITNSSALASDSKAVMADLAKFGPPTGPYIYTGNTPSGWAQVANNNASPASGPPPSGQTGYIGAEPSGVVVPIPSSGSIDLGAAPVGTINLGQGPWTLSGAATLDALNDSGQETMTAGSALSTNNLVLAGNDTTAELASTNNVQFTDSGQTLKLDGTNGLKTTVAGFVQGDAIDLPVNNMTISYDILNNINNSTLAGTVTLWSGKNAIGTLTFTDAAITDLIPQSDGHGGTQIVVDPAPSQIVNPPNNSVNWDYIQQNEGGIWYSPYVIPNTDGGVTVGMGVDLGTGKFNTSSAFSTELQNYQNDPNVLALQNNVLGETGSNAAPDNDATVALGKAGTTDTQQGNLILESASLDAAQVNKMTSDAEQSILTTAMTEYSKAPTATPFTSLPAQVQTVMVDLFYNLKPTTIEKKAIWSAFAQYSASNAGPSLTTIIGSLLQWADTTTQPTLAKRLQGDATLVGQLLPNAISAPPAQMAKSSSANAAILTVGATVTAGSLVCADPTGASSYTLTGNPSSPLMTSIQLPDGDPTADDTPSAYSVSYEVTDTWSAPQTAQPLQTISLPNADAVKVTTLDSNGNPYVSASNFGFFVTFGSSGTFNGTLTSGTSTTTSGSTPPSGSTPATTNFTETDTTTNATTQTNGTPYSGPVAGLQWQDINLTPDNLNITANVPNVFMHSGSGEDALQALSGTNVMDGGTGSNFLVGGGGMDTFFVDDRNATSDIWSSMVNFHAGDAATVWGVTPQDFQLDWADGQGAANFTGLTLHATEAGKPTASLTLTGYTSADLNNGRLSVSFGTDPGSGSPYMYVHGNA